MPKLHEDSRVGVRAFARGRYDKRIRLAKRSDQPYQSHLPALIELASLLKPRIIAEFGMGDFSTDVFLDRKLFPTVERLSSFENDKEWFVKIQQKHRADLRFDPHLVPSPMWKTAMRLHADDFDLIFVDDSNQMGRIKTILALRLARGITRGPVVVVHDVELPSLRVATLVFPYRKYFFDLSPQTAVLCWNSQRGR